MKKKSLNVPPALATFSEISPTCVLVRRHSYVLHKIEKSSTTVRVVDGTNTSGNSEFSFVMMSIFLQLIMSKKPKGTEAVSVPTVELI
jgi:hypothetical protein